MPEIGTSSMWEAVTRALASGATVVVPGRHAAQRLRQRYNAEQETSGAHHWTPPSIRSWMGLLEECWRDQVLTGAASRLLLNPHQERLLWRDIVAEDETLRTLTGSWQLARLAQTAWRLVCAYRIHAAAPFARTDAALQKWLDDAAIDTAAFSRWVAIFQERCTRGRFLSAAELPERLAKTIASGRHRPRHTALALVAFEDLTPAQAFLLDSLRHAGTEVQRMVDSRDLAAGVLARAAEAEDEVLACARWCVRQARTGSSIAVVAPDVERVRPELQRALHTAFAAEIRDGLLFARGARPFAFISGSRLSRQPLAEIAIDILRLGEGPLPLERASRLLQSPYFAPIGPEANLPVRPEQEERSQAHVGIVSEQAARAQMDAQALRRKKKLQPVFTLDSLADMAAASPYASQLAVFRRTVRQMQRLLSAPRPEKASYGRWAERMRRLLATAGFGSAASVRTRAERRAFEAIDGALDSLASLDFSGETIAYKEALDMLTHLVEEQTIPPSSEVALVEILALEDVPGTEFDALWCLNAGENAWPAYRAASGLLSRPLQRSHRMPGADRNAEAEVTANLFRRLRRTAPEVVFSYSVHTNTGKQRPVSALRSASLPEADALSLCPEETVKSGLREDGAASAGHSAGSSQPLLEEVADDQPIAALPVGSIHGGAGLLADQAACGFRAFAEHRLMSSPLQLPELGTDSGRAGEIVHHVLQEFWSELKSQAALRAMGPEDRSTALMKAIDQVLAGISQAEGSAWSAAFLRVERERLHLLLESWLAKELERPDFIVEGHELELRDAQIGPLHLRLRMDRVDRAGDARILIDYKTGTASSKDWEGERPDRPQVPLYAVLASQSQPQCSEAEAVTSPRLGAVALAKVSRKKMGLDGVAATAGLLSSSAGGSHNLAERIPEWTRTLERLAVAFADGEAQVDPKTFPETCRTCKQRMLCRLDVRTLQEDDWLEFSDDV